MLVDCLGPQLTQLSLVQRLLLSSRLVKDGNLTPGETQLAADLIKQSKLRSSREALLAVHLLCLYHWTIFRFEQIA